MMDHRYTRDDAQKGRTLTLPGEYGGYGTSPFGSVGGYGGYAGFGAFNAQETARQAVATGNRLASQAIPEPVWAAVNASPLTAKQKKLLRAEPLSFVIILADHAHDKMIEFVKRVKAMSGNRSSYVMSGQKVTINPRKSDVPAILAAQFLTVTYKNPIQAAIVAGQMHIELAQDMGKMVSAGLISAADPLVKSYQAFDSWVQANPAFKAAQSVSNQVTATATNLATQTQQNAMWVAQQAGKTADQIWQAGEDAINQTTKTVSSWFGFGEPVTGATVGGGAAAGVGAAVEGETLLMTSLVSLIKLAPVLVPMLLKLFEEKTPVAPTQQQVNEAGQANAPGGAGAAADQQLSPAMKQQMQDMANEMDKILGLPRNVAIGGGVALILGLAYVAVRK